MLKARLPVSAEVSAKSLVEAHVKAQVNYDRAEFGASNTVSILRFRLSVNLIRAKDAGF